MHGCKSLCQDFDAWPILISTCRLQGFCCVGMCYSLLHMGAAQTTGMVAHSLFLVSMIPSDVLMLHVLRSPTNSCCYSSRFVVLTASISGLFMLIVATAQDASLRNGLVTAIPPCIAFSAYVSSRIAGIPYAVTHTEEDEDMNVDNLSMV